MSYFSVEKVGKNRRWVKYPRETEKYKGSWELRFLCLIKTKYKVTITNMNISPLDAHNQNIFFPIKWVFVPILFYYWLLLHVRPNEKKFYIIKLKLYHVITQVRLPSQNSYCVFTMCKMLILVEFLLVLRKILLE